MECGRAAQLRVDAREHASAGSIRKETSQRVQCDTYRSMRDAAERAWRRAPCVADEAWQNFTPATNCVWVAYLCDVLLRKDEKAFPFDRTERRQVTAFRCALRHPCVVFRARTIANAAKHLDMFVHNPCGGHVWRTFAADRRNLLQLPAMLLRHATMMQKGVRGSERRGVRLRVSGGQRVLQRPSGVGW